MIVSDFHRDGQRRFTVLSECNEILLNKIKIFFTKMENKDVDPELMEQKVKQKFGIDIKVIKKY